MSYRGPGMLAPIASPGVCRAGEKTVRELTKRVNMNRSVVALILGQFVAQGADTDSK
jgi:hypothetical protein